jgi:cytohesin
MRFLLAHRAKTDVRGGVDGETALHLAARLGKIEAMRLLLDAGAKKEVISRDGSTALMKAVEAGQLPCLIELLERGAAFEEGEVDDEFHRPALVVAALHGRLDAAGILVAHGARVNTEDINDTTALMYACMKGNDKLIDFLLRLGADVNRSDEDAETALTLIISGSCQSKVAIVTRLLAAGADPTFGEDFQEFLSPPLAIAARKGELDIVALLLDRGASVNSRGEGGGETAAFQAARHGKTAAVRLLVSRGANLRLSSQADDEDGYSPLHIAAENGHADTVRALLELDVGLVNLLTRYEEVEGDDFHRGSALHFACGRGFAEVAKILLESGGNIDLQMTAPDCHSCHLRTPLHAAVHNGHAATVQLLLLKGANRMLPTSDGSFPIHSAISREDVNIACMLVRGDTDLLLTHTEFGLCALQLAMRSFKEAGKNVSPALVESTKAIVASLLSKVVKSKPAAVNFLTNELLSIRGALRKPEKQTDEKDRHRTALHSPLT